jgi:hypothetical protein
MPLKSLPTSLLQLVGFGNADGTEAGDRFYFPSGITTDGTNLYVVDSRNNAIRMINM